MRAGEDGDDDAGEDAEGDDGVVVVVLATSRDRREAHLDGLAADAHASEAEADREAAPGRSATVRVVRRRRGRIIVGTLSARSATPKCGSSRACGSRCEERGVNTNL